MTYTVVMEKKISDEKIVGYVKEFTDRRHYSPSFRDFLSLGFVSLSHVKFRIDSLVEAGKLGRDPKVARSIYVKEG
jgi:hypothetical protein